jgi:hypothetical protein
MRSASYFAALTICLLSARADARGASPYLPVNLSPEIERDIERVLILGDSATLTRPIPAARVLDALPEACKVDSKLCNRVRRFLSRYMERAGAAHASVEVSTGTDVSRSLPNRHALPLESPWNIATSGYFQLGDYFLINGGVVAYDGETTPTGSMLSIGFDYAQLDVGYRDHWFSPFTDSSLLIGSNAATMPSVTLSNYAPISPLGFRYELFLAQMSESDNIAFQGRTTSGHPRLAGIHLSIEPAAGWSLGANRLVQFGGGERGGRSAGDFFRALFKPHDYDNTSDSLNSDQEFGNQLGAWTSRMVLPGRTPIAVYFEYAGEDASYSGNYRLGNSALSIGIDFPRLWQSFSFTYEASEWQNGWYVHGIYNDGLTHEGRVVGHWFGDQRRALDGVGGQSHMMRLGWDAPWGGVADLRYRTLANDSYTDGDYVRAHELTLRYSHPWRNLLLGAEATVGRDVFDEDYSRIAAFARFGTDYLPGGGDADDSADDNRTEYFVDAGGSASRVRIELADGSPKYVTPFGYAPHLAIGARRAVSERSDLGARIEFDNIEDALLIAVRALDYRYRFTKHFAASFFAGAARYDQATPAFGYYGGLGVQWRDLLDHIDLSLDVRYGDKLARDKVLPSDPVSTPRPDLFYDLFGATLYFTYKY